MHVSTKGLCYANHAARTCAPKDDIEKIINTQKRSFLNLAPVAFSQSTCGTQKTQSLDNEVDGVGGEDGNKEVEEVGCVEGNEEVDKKVKN